MCKYSNKNKITKVYNYDVVLKSMEKITWLYVCKYEVLPHPRTEGNIGKEKGKVFYGKKMVYSLETTNCRL